MGEINKTVLPLVHKFLNRCDEVLTEIKSQVHGKEVAKSLHLSSTDLYFGDERLFYLPVPIHLTPHPTLQADLHGDLQEQRLPHPEQSLSFRSDSAISIDDHSCPCLQVRVSLSEEAKGSVALFVQETEDSDSGYLMFHELSSEEAATRTLDLMRDTICLTDSPKLQL